MAVSKSWKSILHKLKERNRHLKNNSLNSTMQWLTVLTPRHSRTYGLAIWGCTAASNLAVIQRYQAKTLRQITNAPWHVTNHTLHTDLRIPPVRTVFKELAETHHITLKLHPNPLIATILAPPPRKRLRRRWTLDENS
jgi:1,2-phenylacetyl-CoA epoxidase catalytic subunit